MPKPTASRLSRRERGSALVEGSLVLLVFLTTLIGGVDLSRLLHTHQSLTERVRAAARYGALNPTNEAGIKNMVRFNSASAPGYSAPGAFDVTASMITVSTGTVNNIQSITVTVSNYPVVFLTPGIPGTMRGFPISASSPIENGD